MEETKEDRIEYKIYQIVCNETGEVYFGKTIQTLQERLRCHKKDLKCACKQIILRNKYRIEQINLTFDEEESKILERYYIETYECVNEVIPGRTKKEYYEAHKEEISKYYKERYGENKEEINEKKKVKYTCECGSTLTLQHKARHEKSQKHIDYINSKK